MFGLAIGVMVRVVVVLVSFAFSFSLFGRFSSSLYTIESEDFKVCECEKGGEAENTRKECPSLSKKSHLSLLESVREREREK